MLRTSRARVTLLASVALAACSLPHASLRQDGSTPDIVSSDALAIDGPEDVSVIDAPEVDVPVTDAPDDRPVLPVDVACPSGQMSCGGRCIDVASDATNCGGCGVACPTNATCVTGVCTCPMGQSVCSGQCVSTSSDRANCGLCGRMCPASDVCAGGSCSATCAPPRMMCDARCTDVQTDPMNCGMCRRSCGLGQSCVMGSCSVVCLPPTTNCSGTCVNTLSDSSHCGACGRACRGGASCLAGSCMCPVGTRDCGGTCVPALNNPMHCGACNTVCAAGQVCLVTTCACPLGSTLCGASCVNTLSDPMHCGRCGNRCSAPDGGSAGTCMLGSCGMGTCPSGQHLCGATCVANDSVASCGTRCTACAPVANGTLTCDGTNCGFTCNPGFMRVGAGCVMMSPCGNGMLDSPETCDDGNMVGGDGCSAACQTEPTAFVEACANTPVTIPIRRGQVITLRSRSGTNNDGTGPTGCNADGREVVAAVRAVETGTLTITATPATPMDNWDLVLRYGLGACPGDRCTNAGGGARNAESATVVIGMANQMVAVNVDGNNSGDNGDFIVRLELR